MIRSFRAVVPALVLVSTAALGAGAQPTSPAPDTVIIQNGALSLRGLLWRPSGPGPFPAVLFNHGSGPAEITLNPERIALGAVFARHGYAFLFLFRRGSGLSSSQGENSFDVINRASMVGGQEARNRAQMQLLEGNDLSDAKVALTFLRKLRMVDARRIAVAGHSFGGSLTFLVAERDTSVRAAFAFGPAAGSWEGSPPLRARLRASIGRMTAPVFLIYAENDFSVASAKELSAELERHCRKYRVKIHDAFGKSAEEAHDLIFLGVPIWESEVFAFLDEYMR